MTKCFACQAILRPVTGDSPGDNLNADQTEHWDNALVIALEGGYGMFIDPMHGTDEHREEGLLSTHGEYKVVICHECAHNACEALPWMNHLIAPEYSHTC